MIDKEVINKAKAAFDEGLTKRIIEYKGSFEKEVEDALKGGQIMSRIFFKKEIDNSIGKLLMDGEREVWLKVVEIFNKNNDGLVAYYEKNTNMPDNITVGFSHNSKIVEI